MLVVKQAAFLRKISVLIQVANEIGVDLGYRVTSGDFFRDDRCSYGHQNSLHRSRLAADLNIIKDGALITDATFHEELHLVWAMMGGADMISWDPNHYSLEHNGMS